MKARINTPEDIKNHKDYRLSYEHWMADLKDPTVIKNMADHFAPVKTFRGTSGHHRVMANSRTQ